MTSTHEGAGCYPQRSSHSSAEACRRVGKGLGNDLANDGRLLFLLDSRFPCNEAGFARPWGFQARQDYRVRRKGPSPSLKEELLRNDWRSLKR